MILILVIFFLVCSGIWILVKNDAAHRVHGKYAQIKPFRQNSRLNEIGILKVRLDKMKTEGHDVWFICLLDEPKQIGNFVFDHVKIRPKSVDENFNLKKPVVAYVMGGNFETASKPEFIDWGVVTVFK